MTYSEKLKSPLWQRKRLKIMEYAEWRCQICGVSDRTLHCHHSYYKRGKQPWQYPDGSIICICEKCHEKIHGREQDPAPATEPGSEQQRVPLERAMRYFAELRARLKQT